MNSITINENLPTQLNNTTLKNEILAFGFELSTIFKLIIPSPRLSKSVTIVLSFLNKITNLTHIEINKCSGENALQSIPIKTLNNIKYLKLDCFLGYYNGCYDDKIYYRPKFNFNIPDLQHCHKLEILICNHLKLKTICELSKCKNLKILELNNTDVACILPISFIKIEKLCIANTPATYNSNLSKTCKVIKMLPCIKTLDIGKMCSYVSYCSYECLKYNSTIHELRFYSNYNTDFDFVLKNIVITKIQEIIQYGNFEIYKKMIQCMETGNAPVELFCNNELKNRF